MWRDRTILAAAVFLLACDGESSAGTPRRDVDRGGPRQDDPAQEPMGAAVERRLATDGWTVCWIDREAAHCVGHDAIEPPVVAHPVGVAVAIGQVCVWSDAGIARCRVRAEQPSERALEREIEGRVLEVRLRLGRGCLHRPDSSLSCWRYASSDGAWLPSGPVVVTDTHDVRGRVCGIRGGSAWCRGSNAFGEIVHGCETDECSETSIPEVSGATEIATGAACTCVVAAGGGVACWGCLLDDPHGFWVARDTRTPRWSTAQAIEGFPRPAHDLRAGDHVFCALDAERALHCVQVSIRAAEGMPSVWPVPTRVATDVDAFAVGGEVVCVLRERVVSCFGPGRDQESIVRDLPPPGRVIAEVT